MGEHESELTDDERILLRALRTELHCASDDPSRVDLIRAEIARVTNRGGGTANRAAAKPKAKQPKAGAADGGGGDS